MNTTERNKYLLIGFIVGAALGILMCIGATNALGY